MGSSSFPFQFISMDSSLSQLVFVVNFFYSIVKFNNTLEASKVYIYKINIYSFDVFLILEIFETQTSIQRPFIK